MIDDEGTAARRGRRRTEPTEPRDAAITPDDSASALERGARIFERLLRKRS
ncbi:hypothetical protein ACFOMD_01780 [Sphingoaurantiacus capsulatus]|uniref:Uncharacterized protein n=1 Tax=Sphingoaurantiacus capsulatus TaxID=1771310 RepID=A0ABV7X634_9SPHN